MKLNKWLATSYLLILVVLLSVYSAHYIQKMRVLPKPTSNPVDYIELPIAEDYICEDYIECKVATPSATPTQTVVSPRAGL